jgi:hypothetical protein
VEAAADVWVQLLPKKKTIILLCGYGVKGVLVVHGAVPCQQPWHRVNAIRGSAGVHTSSVSEPMRPAHALPGKGHQP